MSRLFLFFFLSFSSKTRKLGTFFFLDSSASYLTYIFFFYLVGVILKNNVIRSVWISLLFFVGFSRPSLYLYFSRYVNIDFFSSLFFFVDGNLVENTFFDFKETLLAFFFLIHLEIIWRWKSSRVAKIIIWCVLLLLDVRKRKISLHIRLFFLIFCRLERECSVTVSWYVKDLHDVEKRTNEIGCQGILRCLSENVKSWLKVGVRRSRNKKL